MTVLYAIILATFDVRIDGKLIDPSLLATYAINNNKFSTYYIYKPKGLFSCEQLYCQSVLDTYLSGFENDLSNISLKQIDEIILTRNGGQHLNCHNPSILIDETPLYQLYDQLSVSNS